MRPWPRYHLLVALALFWPAVLLDGLLRPADDWLPATEPARVYVDRALRAQRFSTERLAYPSGGDPCGGAPYLGYQRELGSPLSDSWYNAAQLMADATMVQLGQESRRCYLARAVAFLDLVARPDPPGGFYPRVSVDGSDLNTRDTYADDNAFLGLALLEARAASHDPVWRAELLQRAESAARFLTDGGLWDDTFGGGFWWNTNRGEMGEGKPGQTTGMAALLFGRLYEETGRPHHAEWAWRSLGWLERRLFDPATGLYRYNLRHWDMPAQSGEYLDPRLFNYDQGIMIEVHLLFERSLAPGSGHLARARALAEALHTVFWDDERGGYRLEASHPEIYTPYAAWVSSSLLALHAAAPDPALLARARANLDALEANLLDPVDGGYLHMEYRCPRREIVGCQDGAAWARDPTKLLFSQAFVQRAQAQLAARLTRVQ